jgi:ribosome maturation factor RimP
LVRECSESRPDEQRGGGELQVEDTLIDLLTSTVGALGLELVDAEVRVGLVRVVVDREGGADVDALAAATRAVSKALDDHDPQPGRRYTLEVSSPGLERPLRAPEHFVRAVGETVTVRTSTGSKGERRVKGRLVAADQDGFVVEAEGPDEGGRRFAYSEVERARTVFEWPSSKHSEGSRRASTRRRPALSEPAKDTERVSTS